MNVGVVCIVPKQTSMYLYDLNGTGGGLITSSLSVLAPPSNQLATVRFTKRSINIL